MLVEWGVPITGTLQVVDVSGRLLRSYPVSEQVEHLLDPQEFPPGSYLIVLRPDHGVPTTERIVIQ